MRIEFNWLRLWIKSKKWRLRNRHNLTKVEPITEISNITVGNGTYGSLRVLNASDKYWLRIGHFCSIAGNVTFVVCSDHPTDRLSTYPFKVLCLKTQQYEAISKGDIIVEDDVWIGDGATILSGVRIGQGAVVAAGSVVNKDVPPYAIVGGIPAKVIKYRFGPELIEQLLQIDYSRLDEEMIRSNVDKMYDKLEDVSQLDWLPRKDDRQS